MRFFVSELWYIKTKTNDGGSCWAGSSEGKVKSPSSSEKPDAFSAYSNQEVRLNRLLGRHEVGPPIPTNNNTSTVAPTYKETHTTDAILPRKTRLSFKLHESLVLQDCWSSTED